MNRIILWTLCLLPHPCALAAQEMADGSRVARRPVGRFEITRIDQVP